MSGGAGCGIKLWSVAGIIDLQQPSILTQRGFPAEGLTLDDELTLDGALASAAFDDTLDMVMSVLLDKRFFTYFIQFQFLCFYLSKMYVYVTGCCWYHDWYIVVHKLE